MSMISETSQVSDSDDSTSSQSSVSSSSSDAEQVSTNPLAKKCKVQTSAFLLDQYAFGLHRDLARHATML